MGLCVGLASLLVVAVVAEGSSAETFEGNRDGNSDAALERSLGDLFLFPVVGASVEIPDTTVDGSLDVAEIGEREETEEVASLGA